MSRPGAALRPPIDTVPVPACPACGSAGAYRYRDLPDRLYGVQGRWWFRCCEGCGSLWLDPRPADHALAACYPEQYFTHGNGPSPDELAPRLGGLKGFARRHVLATYRGYRFAAGPRRPTVLGAVLGLVPRIRARATHGLGPLLPRWRAGGRLLDVGCGNGAYLALLRAYGWDVVGQEIDRVAAAQAAATYGIPVTTGPLDALAAQGGGFHVVTASHVIEHVPDPASFLRDAAACLRLGGELVVVTPNAAALGHRAFGDRWYPLDPPRHLVVLTPAALRAVALRAGLVDVRVRSLARKATKSARRALAARRSGRFEEVGLSGFERARVRAFAALERAAALVAPVGEELVLTARRPT